MSEKNSKKHNKGLPIWVIALPIIDLVLFIRYLMRGKNIAVLNPKGLIAHEQHSLIVFVLSVLLIVAIPSLFLVYFFAWRYRDTNIKAKHNPNPRRNRPLILFIWAVPTLVMIILASVMWPATHKLVPQKVIAASTKPMTIEVISLPWKWLFLYPDQKIATINFVQLPLNRPITFDMTADQMPMSSFWIPNLGGQLYTMTSHVNRLNLMATVPGDYPGSSAELNGAGFAGMKFTARASSSQEFDQWVQGVRQSGDTLDPYTYSKLLVPTEYNPSKFFSSFDPNLYADVLIKYGHGEHSH